MVLTSLSAVDAAWLPSLSADIDGCQKRRPSMSAKTAPNIDGRRVLIQVGFAAVLCDGYNYDSTAV